ncbi:MAG: DEAD/DEAH box helicase [Deltaproteobacteria bacterium]|nr:DEAD/DEAH box helicase [Deltaproteobacteria bacterium]
MKTISRSFAQELIDFAPTEEQKKMGFSDSQMEGTVAVFNKLARNRCAYLADEVGMGKTYVALGVMSLLRYLDPRARIVVIAPRENIQRKWIKELRNFVRLNWKIVGNRVKSIQGGPAWEPVLCGSLLEFAKEAFLNADRDFFLRMTSFSIQINDEEARRRTRRQLRKTIPWLDSSTISVRTPEGFRDSFGCAINAAIPEVDLVVVDEAHNLKHGFTARGSIRNRIMGLSFGHPEGASRERPWYGPRAKHVLLLSATPFEEDYDAIQRQLAIFGLGDAILKDHEGGDPLRVRDLIDHGIPEASKQKIVERLMIRRVSGLRIAGKLFTKNMYRREWRNGGYKTHDNPMQVSDPKQRLVVALMQKKVAEVLEDERFNNHFQIGMLSSFESFLESVATAGRRKKRAKQDDDPSDGKFDESQDATDEERKGIDSSAIAEVNESYRKRFGQSLPHPKLDATSSALESSFESGEKSLVFVRRVATVTELAAKLDAVFDRWIRRRMEDSLPNLTQEINKLFDQYEQERSLRPEEQFENQPIDEQEGEGPEESEERHFLDEDDEGSVDTFFAWFFRGRGPQNYLSGAAFQKNRLSATSSAYATVFEDDYISWLLGYPSDVLDALATKIGFTREQVIDALRALAYYHFSERSQQKEGYRRLYVFESYQVAALELLDRVEGDFGEKTRVILEERYPGPVSHAKQAPAGFPGPEDTIGITTFFTELAHRPLLRARLWPEDSSNNFREYFRRREQRRELLSAMSRLGASYIDLYLLAVRHLGSFSLRQEAELIRPDQLLAREFADLLEQQMNISGFNSFYELSSAAENFELLLSVNFPEIPSARLGELATIYGATLQRQVPVGRVAGGVNKRLVRQFRMPGFPLVLVSTNVLQEGEDLHTFCRNVLHYGITWTPSAMEQRTGRVDRIGSLVQRRLDGVSEIPSAEEWIQVYYPHLRDTVEVLQVQRVLRRLNRFHCLIHRSRDKKDKTDSRIDTSRAILEDLEQIKPIEGPLESAFPVHPEWLQGQLASDAVQRPDVDNQMNYLDHLWRELCERKHIQPFRSWERRIKESSVPVLSDAPDHATQKFRLELRSQAAGDSSLLRCVSDAGQIDLRDDKTLDRLYTLQRDLGQVKIRVWPDTQKREDLVSVQSGILFHQQTTQVEEIEAMVNRTTSAAYWIHRLMISEASGILPMRVRGSDNAREDLLQRIDELIKRSPLPWTRTDSYVDVELQRSKRKQSVHVGQRGDMVVFSSVVVGSKHVTQSSRYWRELAYRTWRKNAVKELITFAFDKHDRLVGLIEQPIATLDNAELQLYIEIVAKECDRFEYALTGQDKE